MAENKPRRLSHQEARELEAALLACPVMRDPHRQAELVKKLPMLISNDSRPTVAVSNILASCLVYPNGIPQLLTALRFFEGESLPMQRVQKLVETLWPRAGSDEELYPLIDEYLARLTQQYEQKRRKPYIPLEATRSALAGGELVQDICARLLRVNRGLLLGEPGSGKSWTLEQVALRSAEAWRAAPPEQRARLRIPIHLPLDRYTGEQSIKGFVEAQAVELAPHLTRLLRMERLFFLCDALNEMPRHARGGRDPVKAVEWYLHDKPYFIISCRELDDFNDLEPFHDQEQFHPLESFSLRELDPPRVHAVLKGRLGEQRGEAVWQEMIASRLHPLMHPPYRNPFMVGLLCDLYEYQDENKAEARPPSSRAALFTAYVANRLAREEAQALGRGEGWPGTPKIEAMLVRVAAVMQETKANMLDAQREFKLSPTKRAPLEAAISAGLLVKVGYTLRFSHPLLQDYFAARVLLAAMEGHKEAGPLFGAAWWEAGVWGETAVTLGELLGERVAGPNRVARWLAPASPEVALQVILESSAGLTLADMEPQTRELVLQSAREKTGETHLHGRAAAYRVLGLFDVDDRPGVGLRADGLLPDIAWVEIPAGKIRIRGDQQAHSRLPPEKFDLPTFWMAKYPITYRQFQAFIDAPDGFYDRRWWEEARKPPAQPGQQAFPYWNHPREEVNWYEATAFCRWLSSKLGYEVRLPTEEEWEKAARGIEYWEYPWGDEYVSGCANLNERYDNSGPYFLGQTSAVGIYPQGASPYGVLDMSGNVAEWTASAWEMPQAPSSTRLTGALGRVERGGSWGHTPWSARGSAYSWCQPDIRNPSLGFRVVCADPTPSDI